MKTLMRAWMAGLALVAIAGCGEDTAGLREQQGGSGGAPVLDTDAGGMGGSAAGGAGGTADDAGAGGSAGAGGAVATGGAGGSSAAAGGAGGSSVGTGGAGGSAAGSGGAGGAPPPPAYPTCMDAVGWTPTGSQGCLRYDPATQTTKAVYMNGDFSLACGICSANPTSASIPNHQECKATASTLCVVSCDECVFR